jgi:hypothetical protein
MHGSEHQLPRPASYRRPSGSINVTRQLLKQTHATDLFLANMGSGRLTDGDARNSHSTGR